MSLSHALGGEEKGIQTCSLPGPLRSHFCLSESRTSSGRVRRFSQILPNGLSLVKTQSRVQCSADQLRDRAIRPRGLGNFFRARRQLGPRHKMADFPDLWSGRSGRVLLLDGGHTIAIWTQQNRERGKSEEINNSHKTAYSRCADLSTA